MKQSITVLGIEADGVRGIRLVQNKSEWRVADRCFWRTDGADASADAAASEDGGAAQPGGIGDDAAWRTAAVTDDFRGTPNGYGLNPPKIDERLKTEVKILRDTENFYLLMTVKEPKLAQLKFAAAGDPKIWGQEHLEVIFYPPVIDCRTYQLAFNADGAVAGLSNPGGAETDYGVEAVAKKGEDGYVVEAKIPNRLIHAFVPGERWKVLFGRYRALNDEIVPNHWQRAFSVGGCNFQDATSYTPVDVEK